MKCEISPLVSFERREEAEQGAKVGWRMEEGVEERKEGEGVLGAASRLDYTTGLNHLLLGSV